MVVEREREKGQPVHFGFALAKPMEEGTRIRVISSLLRERSNLLSRGADAVHGRPPRHSRGSLVNTGNGERDTITHGIYDGVYSSDFLLLVFS